MGLIFNFTRKSEISCCKTYHYGIAFLLNVCYTGCEVMNMPTAKTRAVRKFNAKSYDRIEVIVHKGEKDVIAAYAKSLGMTTNGFIVAAIKKAMAPDNE